MTTSDEACASFMSRFTCSSAIFSAFSHELGLDPYTAKKIACGFGAGLKYGKTRADDEAATEKTRDLVRRFLHEFTEKNGSVNCTKLLGYDLRDPEAFSAARDSGLFRTKCPEYVRDSADILERML